MSFAYEALASGKRVMPATQATELLDGTRTFLHDPWKREGDVPNPGHGITAVLEGGNLLEKVSLACCRWTCHDQSRGHVPS